MEKRKISLCDIISLLGDELIKVCGELSSDLYVDNISDVEHTTESTLDWIKSGNKNKQGIAEASKAKVVIVDKDVAYSEKLAHDNKILLVVNNPRKALAMVGNAFFVRKGYEGIHPTAIINDAARIGNNVSIGPYSIVDQAEIGNNCIIGAHVHIYDNCKIGNNCVFLDNTIIGDVGFGFVKDENNQWCRFPQIGGVVVGDNVEVGSFSSIDRGALSDTIIGHHTKIGSHCKIAHNNVIGNNVIIAGSCIIAGSNVIEDNVWVSPNSSLKDWGHIGKDSFVGMGSVVVTKVKPNSRVFGNPAKKISIV